MGTPFLDLPANAALDTHTTVNLVVTVVLLVEVAVALAYVGRAAAARSHRSLGLVMILGGALGALGEPFCSVIGHVQYPNSHQVWVVMTVFGTSIPLWMFLSYALMMGVGSFVLLMLLENGGGGRAVLKMWVVLIVSDLVFQYPLLGLHTFRYYGPNAFEVVGLPLWWLPLDSSLGIAPALIVYAVGRDAWRWQYNIALVVFFPAAQIANYIVPAWPTWTLSNSTDPGVWLWFATALTVGASATIVRVLAMLADRVLESRVPAGVAAPRPADADVARSAV